VKAPKRIFDNFPESETRNLPEDLLFGIVSSREIDMIFGLDIGIYATLDGRRVARFSFPFLLVDVAALLHATGVSFPSEIVCTNSYVGPI
jgi:hypothetical protein